MRGLIVLGIAFVSALIIVNAGAARDWTTTLIGVGVGLAGFWWFGRGKKGRSERLRVGYDFITVTLMGVFFLSIQFGGLGGIVSGSQPSINVAEFLLTFWAGGVIMWLISGVFDFKAEVGQLLFQKQVRYIALSFAAFFLTNLLVPPTVPLIFSQSVLFTQAGTLSSSGKLTTVLIGVPEEAVFRGWLAPWLANISRTGVIGGSIGSAALFLVYHFFVLGTSGVALTIIFGDGLVQGYVCLKTGVLGTSLFNHLGNNFLSVEGL